jgi:translation initiation factor IF-2
LAENDLVVEEWGGDVICVPVSAKQQTGIEELLENLLLLADVEGFRADPEGAAIGTVIESSLDKARGATATLLVQKGTLKVGDAMVVGTTSGRVRALFDSTGRPVDEAKPSIPVVVLGLSDVPTAGDTFQVVKDDRTARDMAAQRIDKERQRDEAAAPKAISLDEVFAKMKAGDVKELRIVLKADVDGSLEPIINSLEQLSTEDLRIKLLHTGTGDISESDLMLAAASHAIVIGFHVELNQSAQRSDLANQVDVRSYSVIYELIDDVDKALKGLLEPVYEDQTIGQAEVRAVFRIPRRGNIAGCYVSEGEIQRSALARVQRNGTVVHESKINSLKRFQDDVTEVKTGFECGIGLENFDEFEEGDIIVAYHKVRV